MNSIRHFLSANTMRIVFLCVLLCCRFVACAEAATDTNDGDLLSMSFEDLMVVEVVTSASKYAQPISQAPMAMNVLTAEDIERSGAKTIPDLLKRFPGVWTWTKTRSDQDIGMMGLNGDDCSWVMVLLDGQPINSPLFGGMQWPQLPITLEDIERIEVIRGGGSALYGADAFTGVINIITKSPKNRKSSINSYFGEAGIHNHTGTFAHTWDKLSLSVTSGWRQTHSKGDFDSVYNRGEQDFYNTPVFNAKLEYEITKNQKATFLSGYSKGEGGYAASPGDPSIDRVDDWRQTLFQGQYFNTALGHTDFSVKAGVYKVDQQNFKPYTAGTPEKYKVHGKRYHVETNVLTRIVPQHTLIGGFVHQHTEADSAGVVNHLGAPTESRHHEYDLMGYFLQDEYKLTDYLSLINSARYDMYDDIDDQFTMRNTAMWYINKKNTLRFSVGNAYRRNDIYDMYYYVDLGGPYFHGGGPRLEQQRVRNYELEYRTQLIPNHTVKVELFKSKYKNFTYATGFPEITISSSGNKYTIRGFTLEIDGEPVKDKFKWYANYTYYDAKDVTNHIRMEDVPRFMFNAGVQYFPIKNLYLSTDLHYQDGCEDVVLAASDGINGIPSNTEIPAFTTVDAKIGYFPKENIELSISVENLFNDKHYEYPGHSERGRTLYAGVRIVW